MSIFDHLPTGAKTGIRDRALRPTLAVIDPDHTDTCSPQLTAFSGLDVLCHALESFTAVPYRQRITGAPHSPLARPAYQGSNPIAEIWSGYALKQCSLHLRRAVEDNDPLAREQMCLASTAAGVGFGEGPRPLFHHPQLTAGSSGNAGVHLCHAMSYPISSLVRSYRPQAGYEHASKAAIVPHGLSVILTAPAVFKVNVLSIYLSVFHLMCYLLLPLSLREKWTCIADPDRHLRAAGLLGNLCLLPAPFLVFLFCVSRG